MQPSTSNRAFLGAVTLHREIYQIFEFSADLGVSEVWSGPRTVIVRRIAARYNSAS
jgi:hypothetical protein